MQVIIQKIANEHNLFGELVSHVYETHVLDDRDVCALVGLVLSAISQRDDLKITFSEE